MPPKPGTEPVVVQGVAVASPYDHRTSASHSAPQPAEISQGNWNKGEKQPTQCRDIPFAILFYAHLAAMFAVVGIYGVSAFVATVNVEGIDYEGYLYAALILCLFAIAISGVMFLIMMAFAEFLIKVALFFVVIMTLAWAVISFLYGSIGLGILGLIFFAIGVCYAKAVWSRIPFATVNLVTAMTAVKKNCGVIVIAFFMVTVAMLWSLLWTVALIGIYDKNKVCNNGTCVYQQNYGYLFLLLVSYFWTHQVIQNTIHVTVAGVVGTWWFTPDEASFCCSKGVIGSYFRAVTTSFGSICFGSLIVAVIQALRQLAYTARQEGADYGFLICIAECILSCIESLIEYFNKWAYVYVGVYGYSYIEAGKNVMKLFQDRGWEAIIADDLVGNTLFLVSLICGMLTGCVGLILTTTSNYFDDAGQNDKVVAFVLGLIIGLVLTSIVMSVVGSGVNTVIVCYADGPAEFQANHPALSEKMRETWRGSFPDYM